MSKKDVDAQFAALEERIEKLENSFRTLKNTVNYTQARTIQDLDNLLGGFQRENIQVVSKLNVVWNSINAIILSFLKKNLISESDIVESGKQLMAEAQANMQAAKETGPKKVSTPVPLETTQKLLERAASVKVDNGSN